MERLVLIDGNALLHRAYHAYPQTLRTGKGELTNAVYGFTSILLTVFRQLKPKYAVMAFDLPKPTFRHRKYKAYKAHRPKIDQELKEQIPRAHQIVETLNIPIFEVEGYEADDVIGTLAGNSQTLKTIIVTGDKDALQLINNRVKVFMPGRGKRPARMVDRKAFLKEYGFEPRLLVDYKALVGDPSDAIPGVKGIGPKTATKLIVKFGSLRDIYDNLDRLDVKTRQRLTNQEEQAKLSYKLAQIITQVPLEFNLEKSRLLDYDRQKVEALFEELEFRTLMARLPGEGGDRDNQVKARNSKFTCGKNIASKPTNTKTEEGNQMELF